MGIVGLLGVSVRGLLSSHKLSNLWREKEMSNKDSVDGNSQSNRTYK